MHFLINQTCQITNHQIKEDFDGKPYPIGRIIEISNVCRGVFNIRVVHKIHYFKGVLIDTFKYVLNFISLITTPVYFRFIEIFFENVFIFPSISSFLVKSTKCKRWTWNIFLKIEAIKSKIEIDKRKGWLKITIVKT